MSDQRHGGLYDRGMSDSYYHRGRNPHYFKGNSFTSEKVVELTQEEINEYNAGFDYNENELRDFKDWG